MNRSSSTATVRPLAARPISQRPATLAGWLTDHGETVDPPVKVTRDGSRQSNITSVVTDSSGQQWLLSEPAPGRANKLDREANIMTMLAGSGFPLPRVVGSAATPTGAPFMVMQSAYGSVIITEDDARNLSPERRNKLGIKMVALLAHLHSLDPAAAGLPKYRLPYLDRQIGRMTDIWARSGSISVHDAAWRAVRSRLLQRRPARQPRPMLLHGDFRLSNVMTHRGRVSAVLGWELCTAGDPMADLAWLLNDWRARNEPASCVPSPTRAGGFLPRSKLIDAYAQLTGSSLEHLGYYRGLTSWRGATLLQNILAHDRAVADDQTGVVAESFDHSIATLLSSAAKFLAEQR